MFYVGVDLGQSNDYTAIAIGERISIGELRDGRGVELSDPPPWRLHVRHLERFRHRLYPDVATHLERLVERLPRPCEMAVDATGVGPAVTDLLTIPHHKVTITGGDKVSREGRSWRVPKRDLVSGLQVLLQSGRLKIASSLEHAETLRSELLSFRVKVNPQTAHDSYAAWREGDHDDLVLAACLCAWVAARGGVVDPSVAGVFGDPISDADLYRWEDFPRARTEEERDAGIFPSDPYAG